MERRRLADSPKRSIYKRDNTAIKSVCQGEMCGKCTLFGDGKAETVVAITVWLCVLAGWNFQGKTFHEKRAYP